MKLSDGVLERLAEMVTGNNSLFPYRSSSFLTQFFKRCGFAYVHDGSTRKWWTKERLTELNLGASQAHDLPSDDLVRVISELFDPDDFEKQGKDREAALKELNQLLARRGLAAYFDVSGRSGEVFEAFTQPGSLFVYANLHWSLARAVTAFSDFGRVVPVGGRLPLV